MSIASYDTGRAYLWDIRPGRARPPRMRGRRTHVDARGMGRRSAGSRVRPRLPLRARD
jgi:hypothetical protein